MNGKRWSGTPYLRGEVWWIRYTIPSGREVRESSRSTNREDAVKLLALRNTDMRSMRERLLVERAQKKIRTAIQQNKQEQIKRLIDSFLRLEAFEKAAV